MTRTKRLVAALAVALGVGWPASVAAADPPHTVDPLTVTPALNPEFAPWTCLDAGTGITCTGTKAADYDNEATDIDCGGPTVYVTGSETAKTVRWHTTDGLALKTSLQGAFVDRLSLSPDGTGSFVVLSGHWHKHYDYPVPGDPDARVLTETGAILRLTAEGDGVLFQDTGAVTYVPSGEYEVVAQMHGVHDRFSGGRSVEAAICEALGAG